MLNLRLYKNSDAQAIVKWLNLFKKQYVKNGENERTFIKLKDKFIKFCKWVWEECKDWHTVVIFAVVVVVMYSPVWGGYLCHALFGWKWCSVMATAYLAFWAGPFTPFFRFALQ